jgi:hypothetical protein
LKRAAVFVGALALLCARGTALAAAPTAAQKQLFLKECLKNSGGNTTLCDCKAEQAMTLIDADFMQTVLDSMNGKPLPASQSGAYGVYISKSNAVCAPGM